MIAVLPAFTIQLNIYKLDPPKLKKLENQAILLDVIYLLSE